MPKPVKIVIAICTCNRTFWLRGLIDSIVKGHESDGVDLAILIVDNYKIGNAKGIAEEKSNSKYPIHYIQEKKAGIPFARNSAMRKSVELSAEALIFIDDDEVVRLHWLRSLISHYLSRQPVVQVVQGPVHPIFLSPLPSWMPRELYGKVRSFKTGEKLSIASTNNVIIDLRLYTEHGFIFNESMAMCGGSDTDFFRRINESGFRIEWCKEAISDEYIPADRLTLTWILKRHYRFGASNSLSLTQQDEPNKVRKAQVKKALYHLLLGFKHLKRLDRTSAVYVLRHLAEALGLIAGLWGLQYNEYKAHHK